MQGTLAAYYGDKPPALSDLIQDCQEQLSSSLGDSFRPYALRQVHATIVGLEGVRVGQHILNSQARQAGNEAKPVGFVELFNLLRGTEHLPLTISIGGYQSVASFPFRSRGQHPYTRSFSVQGNTAVAMGWPCAVADYPPSLDRLRRAFNTANVVHKYHRQAEDIDNDLFFVLGHIDRKPQMDSLISAVEEKMRAYMAKRSVVEIMLATDQISLLLYSDPALPPETTRIYSLDRAELELEQIVESFRVEEA